MFLQKRLIIKVSIVLLSVGFMAISQGCSDNKQEIISYGNVSQTSSKPIEVIESKEIKFKDQKRESRAVYSVSDADITALFKEINYSLVRWNEGVREIPRLYITDISSRWQIQSQKMNVKRKKAIFFQFTIPIVLRANELILEERKKLLHLSQNIEHISEIDRDWLNKLAIKYKLINKDGKFKLTHMSKLLSRVDVIPPSLSLAQAAEESGWGTSRFAVLGNSLFGQWSFSKDAMRPKEQRVELGNYGLARFDTPQDAVNAYMLNLNTHLAYKPLRELRSYLNSKNIKVTGKALANTLDKYSERGEAYVDSLHAMMRINHLEEADNAYLWDRENIYLIPIE